MIPLITCKNGHRYDPSLTSECPECVVLSALTWDGEILDLNMGCEKNEICHPLDVDAPADFQGEVYELEEYSVCYPVSCELNEVQKKEQEKAYRQAANCTNCHRCYDPERYDRCPVCGDSRYLMINGVPEDILVNEENRETREVVGWLDCISGNEKGKRYYLYSGATGSAMKSVFLRI